MPVALHFSLFFFELVVCRICNYYLKRSTAFVLNLLKMLIEVRCSCIHMGECICCERPRFRKEKKRSPHSLNAHFQRRKLQIPPPSIPYVAQNTTWIDFFFAVFTTRWSSLSRFPPLGHLINGLQKNSL
jgi:hypothetical protein